MKFASQLFGGMCLLATLSQTGCLSLGKFLDKETPSLDTSLLEAQGYSVPQGGMPMQVDAPTLDKPSIVLEVRSGKKSRHVERIPISTDEGVFIQDIVQQAQLHERFGRLRINIMRPNGPQAPPVRMDCRTDDDGKTDLATNYALQPGDHVIINEDNRSSLERFIDSQFSNG